MSYYYYMTQVNWCDDYEDIPLYDTIYSRNYDICGASPAWSPLFNFNFGNGIKTTTVVNNYNPENQNYFCLVDESFSAASRKYYFIESFDYLSENQYRLQLTLDVFVTYFQDLQQTFFPRSIVSRAHYPRFYREGNNFVFNVNSNNPICQGSPKYAMRTTSSNELQFNWSSNATVAGWCNANDIMWAEVYVQPNSNFRFVNTAGGAVDTPLPVCNTVGELSSECSVMCFPVRPSGNATIVFRVRGGSYLMAISGKAFKDWLELNGQEGGSNYIYNIKLSPRPIINFNTDYYVNSVTTGTYDGGPALYVDFTEAALGYDDQGEVEGIYDRFNNGDQTPVAYYGRYVSLFQTPNYGRGLITAIYKATLGDYISNDVNINERFSFTIEELTGVKKMMFEPKIMQYCKTLKLRDVAGNSIDYSPLWLNSANVRGIYTEAFGISNTNYYLRVKSSGLYPNIYQQDWHGVVSTINLSLNIANDNLGAFLVQNKNYVQRMDWLADNGMYMQMINTAISAPLRLLGASASLATGNPIPTMGAAWGTGGSIIGSFLDNYNNKQIARTMYNFNKQDAMNSVNTLRNTNDNLSLPIQVNQGIKFYLDKMEAYECEQEIEYNNLFMYGYDLNLLENPYYFLAGAGRRKYFNYLQAHVEQLFISCPREAEKIIRHVLDRGARFWHLSENYGMSNMYNYDKENYETFIN